MKSKKSLRILYIHNANFDKASANRVQVISMCNAFVKGSVSLISLLTTGSSEKDIRRKYNISKIVEIHLIKPINNYYLRSLKLILEFLKIRKTFNVIYTRDILVAYLIKLFSTDRYVCYEVHEIRESFFWRFMFKRVTRTVDKVISISNGLKDELDIRFKPKDNLIEVLPDGVDMDLFYVPKTKEETREILSLPEDKKIILYIGSLQKWKGYQTFIDSSKDFIEDLDTLFVIVGGSPRFTEKLRLKHKNIYFKDRIKSYLVPYYLRAADILVIPNSSKEKISTTYTSPLKLFESMASKTPIIVSDLPSIREIVDENDVTFFKPDSGKDLSKKISYILENKNEAKKKANTAFEKVKNYTWTKRVERLITLIRK